MFCLGDAALFRSITNYIDARIAYFTESTLSNVMTIVGTVALVLLTLWIIWYGYQIVMGSSQHSAKDFVFKAVRAWIIIAFATGVAATMGFSIRTMTTTMSDAISQTLTNSADASACTTQTGQSGFMGCKIDQNLLRTQAAMAFVNQLDTGGDPVLEDKKSNASLMMSAGIGGPAIVAGALLLTLKVAMALFIALGPMFIMCLLFKPTTPLFQKWLYYGLSTMFATAMLAVVSDISMDLVENISATLFAADMFSQVTGITALSSNTAGIMQASVQQLGLGLILSTLLISTPPMAANFFNGVMGSFNPVSSMQNFVPSQTAHTKTAPSASGAQGAPASPAPNTTGTQQTTRTGDAQANPAANAYIPSNNASVNKDVIKTDSPVGNASKGFASNEVVQADRAIKDPAPSTPSSANKAGLMLLIGTAALMNGGVEKAYAQGYWEQAQQQQQQQQRQQEQINQQNQMMHSPQYACVNGKDIYGYIGDAACGGGQSTNTRPVPPKPSSYGAVAWGNNYFGNSSNQTSKQNAINAALQKCGESSCQIANLYSNQCVAFASGINSKGAYTWQVSNGLTQVKAQKAALKDCNKSAKNCQVKFSECSLPDSLSTN